MSIFIKHSQPFTAVPNYLVNDENISVEALGVITYLAGKPTGWIARAYDIRKRFKWGDFTWRRVAKELRALGVLSHSYNADGTQLVFELKWEEPIGGKSVSKPVDKPCDPPVGKSTMGKPTVGKPRAYKERLIKKDLLEINNYEERNNCSKIEQSNKEQKPLSAAEKKFVIANMQGLLRGIKMK